MADLEASSSFYITYFPEVLMLMFYSLVLQTGSGKTLAYLLLIFSVINTQRSAVQALIVVPTRELGMQVRLFGGDSVH